MPSALHWPAPEVAEIGRSLLQHHEHLLPVRVEYVFRDEAVKNGDHTVWGRAHKVTGMKAMLATADAENSNGCDFFIIEIAYDIWRLLSPAQRTALVDHEMCHLGVEVLESGAHKLVLRNHDVEEFVDVVSRHGLWRPILADLVSAAGPTQLRMLADVADELSELPDEEPEPIAHDADDVEREGGDDEIAERHKVKITTAQRDVLGLDDKPATAGAPEPTPVSDADWAVRARHLVITTQVGSTSLLQRRLKIGYGRAARVIDQLHLAGILGAPDGSKPRDVLVGLEDLDRICGNRED